MSEKWVTAWGNAISVAERRPENYAKNLTLRYPAKMMLDGSALRITLDNFCGNTGSADFFRKCRRDDSGRRTAAK